MTPDSETCSFAQASTSVDAGIITNTSLGLSLITIGPSVSLLSWNNDNTGSAEYIGFSFTYNSQTCYGWASITIHADSGNMGALTINSWAFEDSGANIRVRLDFLHHSCQMIICAGRLPRTLFDVT